LDPINHIIFYNMALSPSIVRPVILDMTNDQILQKWEGATFISPLVFSENGKYAAFCRNIGYNNRPNKDKLIIFDLTEKKIIYNETFTCSGVSLAITQDGTKLAIEHYYLKNPTDARYSLRFVIFNTLPPYDKKYLEIESSSRAAVFSPDNSLLAIACGESDICFFDVATNNKIYQLKAHSHITNLAFSPDGNSLATSSDWGLVSLWAVPPFVNNPSRTQSSSLPTYNPSFSWDFNQDGNFEGWEVQNQLDPIQTSNGNLVTKSTGNDPFMISPTINADAASLSHIEIRMKISAGNYAELYFMTNSEGTYDESKVLRFPITADGQFHTYIIDMTEATKWNGVITQIRLDPVVTQATIEIDYIRLLP